jgi:hypothetical protein
VPRNRGGGKGDGLGHTQRRKRAVAAMMSDYAWRRVEGPTEDVGPEGYKDEYGERKRQRDITT